MSELTPLISDLALILVCAGVMTVVFKRLKQPLVLGYIVAGKSPFYTHPFGYRYGQHPYLVGDWCHLPALCPRVGVQLQEVGKGGRNGGDSCLLHHLQYDSDRDDGGVVFRLEINGLPLFGRDAGDVFHHHYLQGIR